LPETISRFQFFNEHGFAIQCIPGCRQALVERPGAIFQICPRQRACAPIKNVCQSAGKPIFEDSNTSQGVHVTELPISPQFWFLSQREMSLEAEDHPLKGDDIIRIIDPISTEMDVETAAAQLRTQIAAGQQLVGSNQHVDTAGQAGQGFEAIQLVGKTAPTRNFRKVLGLIDEYRRRSSMTQSLFQRLT
jgi:hypothetical protein